MLIDQYYNDTGNQASFTRLQSSNFAKKIADDFNPLHNTDAKRFCVPGDLLFSMVLAKYGISKHMRFTFSGMVTEDVSLSLPNPGSHLSMKGNNGKEYLSVEHLGENTTNNTLIDNLTRRYVTFSGHTFPHILIPLMEQQDVMINPERPMVMYQSMLIDLDTLDINDIQLELDKEKTKMDVSGKRGNVCLAFNLLANNEILGRGEKHMVVSGLQPYNKAVVENIIADYAEWKRDFSLQNNH